MTLLAPPPAPAPAPLTPGSRTTVRVSLTVAAAALVVATVAALGTAAWASSRLSVGADSTTLPATVRMVTVGGASVSVDLRVTSDPQAREPRVELRSLRSSPASSPVTVTPDGTAARITLSAGRGPLQWWGDVARVTVVLPPETARRLSVTAEQDRGDVTVEATGSSVDRMTVRTSDGDVRLSGGARRVDVTTGHGDVDGTAVAAEESFSATTSTGDIGVDFTTAPRTTLARTGFGDIHLMMPPPGPYLVDATTGQPWGSAEVRVPQTSDAARAAGTVTARTDTGDVTVDAAG